MLTIKVKIVILLDMGVDKQNLNDLEICYFSYV